jgi:hypothetical protein
MELAVVVTCCCNDCKYNAVKQFLSKSQQNTVIFGGSGNRVLLYANRKNGNQNDCDFKKNELKVLDR